MRFGLQLGYDGDFGDYIEGLHGVPFDAPLGRTREIVEICRQDRVIHQGRYYQVPLPETLGTGLGKALKIINKPVRDRIPISVAAAGPGNVALAAEIV